MPEDGNGTSRSITGEAGTRLPDPGTDARTSAIVSPGVPDVEGVPSAPASVDNTPTASGETPRRIRDAARVGAESAVDASTDAPVINPDDREGPAPHYFTERVHQSYYHDVIIYIEGEDVSPFLTGTVAVSHGFGSDPNTCSFSLDNAGHRFTLTPENLKGEFRRASPIEQFGPIDYDETIKANMYARKGSSVVNPVDPDSGGRRFPLHLWGPIFHKYDAVRVWIHNPVTERDEWIPAFTGFITNKPTAEDYIKGSNKITVSCKDVRTLMQKMRVNTNTVLTSVQSRGSGADPTNQNFIGNSAVTTEEIFNTRDHATSAAQFADSSNRSFSHGFFADVVRGSNFENPWTSLTLPNLIASLTFLPKNASRALIESSDAPVVAASSQENKRAVQAAARLLQPLQSKVVAGGMSSLSDTERGQYRTLLGVLQTASASANDITTILNGSFFEAHPQSDENSAAAQHASGTAIVPDHAVGVNFGSGRIGRMRPGVFPWTGTLFGDPPRPYYIENKFPATTQTGSHNTGYYEKVARHMEKWYSLCFFGTPLRHDPSLLSLEPISFDTTAGATSVAVSDSAPNHSVENRRYWTENEVRAAGMRTTREGAWHPTAQAVHFLSPGTSTPATELLWSQKTISSTPTAQSPNWSTRLETISKACQTADYRFWVSGCGDLIFEFAQYDFSPQDYGAWEGVLTLDHHLTNETLDDEGGEIKTGFSVTGSLTALGDISESSVVQDLNPIKTIGVWSPNLASRLGINIGIRSYPQITDENRLEQVATLEFQRALATADKYTLSLSFRPWLLMNRPIYNKYRSRYALIDNLSWSYPVTAGALPGHTVPSMKVTLNYTRSLDEVGVPRYITGGPSNALYFARPANAGASSRYLNATTQRIRDFASALRTISTAGELTQQQRDTLRDRYRAIVPSGQNSYNVISSLLLTAGSLPPGEEDPRITALRGIESDVTELLNNPGAFTPQELQNRIQELEARSAALSRSLEEDEPIGSYEDQTSAGYRPIFGRSGVRSTLSRGHSPRVTSGTPAASGASEAEDAACNPGNPDLYSSPVGPALRNFLAGRDRRRLAEQFGAVDPSEIPSSVGVNEFVGGFPRYAAGRYTLRARTQWHRGVDIHTVPGAPVYAVATGVVVQVKNQPAPIPRRGPFRGQRNLDPQTAIVLLHKEGYVTVYRHLNPSSVSVTSGTRVERNTKIGEVALSGAERLFKPTHLHFETGALQGSPVFNKYVVDEKVTTKEGFLKFWIITAADIRGLRATSRTQIEALVLGSNDTGHRVTAADRGSLRVMYRAALDINSLNDDNTSGLDLSFLRRSNGTFRSRGSLILTWSPLPTRFPFSRAYNASPPYGPTGRDKELLSLEEYLSQFSLKGIPALNLMAKSSAASRRTVPVPEISTGGSSRATARAERLRARAIRQNERAARRLQEDEDKLNAQRSLFSAAVPPGDCPPGSFTVAAASGTIDLSEPPPQSVFVFFGKSVFIRGPRFYPRGDFKPRAKASGIDTVYLSTHIGKHSRAYADAALRDGFKVGWWVTQSEMVPESYRAAISARVSVSLPGEPIVLNWERAPRWTTSDDRAFLYSFIISLVDRNPIGISTLDRYRYETEAAAHLSGHVTWMPQQYDLTNSLDEAARATSRARLARKFGGPDRVIPTVAGYGRSKEDLAAYLQTFNQLKGGIMWETSQNRPSPILTWTPTGRAEQ